MTEALTWIAEHRDALRRFDWGLTASGSIRCLAWRPEGSGRIQCCPMSAALPEPAETTGPLTLAARWGISLTAAEMIVRAADDLTGHSPEVRRSLLDACEVPR